MQVQGNLQRTETLLGLKQEKCRAAVAQVEPDGHVCKVGNWQVQAVRMKCLGLDGGAPA